MEPIRTMLDAWAKEGEYVFSVEKWWMPTAAVTAGKVESYTGIGLVHARYNGDGISPDIDVVLLSLERAETLAKKILEVVEKARA